MSFPASTDRDVYVLATLGTSPAVVTELLWWLVTQEGRRVVGVEVWTTGGGVRAAQAAWTEQGRWEALRSALGDRCDAIPPLPSPLKSRPIAHPGGTTRGVDLRVIVDADGSALDDIRSAADAEVTVEHMNDRLRALVRSLPQSVALVGSLAGGRKTMSAHVQSVFSLHARPDDRLVHVLLHPEVEQKHFRAHHFPGAEFTSEAVPTVADQLQLCEIAFPLVRALLPPERREVLDQESYDATLRDLRRVRSASEVEGIVEGAAPQRIGSPRSSGRLSLRIGDRQRTTPVVLVGESAGLLLLLGREACQRWTPAAIEIELAAAGWIPPERAAKNKKGDDAKAQATRVHKKVQRLKDALKSLLWLAPELEVQTHEDPELAYSLALRVRTPG